MLACLKKQNIFWNLSLSVVLALFLVGLAASTASAQVNFNQQINYQGKLTDNLGATVADGVYNIAFNLYDSTQTNIIWTSTTTATTTNGLFSYMLGSSSTLSGVDFNQTLYLSVNIGGIGAPSWDGEMSPRKILGAVPAAFEADNAQTLDNIATSSFVRSDQADTIAATTASTLLTITQSGSGDILNLFDDTNEVMTVLDGGNVGIGTTSPYAKLSVAGHVVGQYFTATSTATSTFPTLSVTGSFYDSAGTAGANGYVLQTDGTSVSWVATSSLGFASAESVHDPVTLTGIPDYLTLSGQQITLGLLDLQDDLNTFSSTNLTNRLTDETGTGLAVFATNPLLSGFRSLASSTIGDGTQSGGLTISGGATTTGNAYFTGKLLQNASESIYDVHFADPVSSMTSYFQSGAASGRAMHTVGMSSAAGNAQFDLRAYGSGYSETLFGNSMADASAMISLYSSKFIIGNYANTDLIFGTNNAERARITNTGNFGIGTTSPYAKLSVAGHVVGQYFTATSTATSTFPTLSVTGALYDSAGTAGANGYVLQTDGTSVSWVATSSLNISSGSSITFGTNNQIPYMNGTTDFQYSSNLTFDGANMSVLGTIAAATSSTAASLIAQASTTVTGADVVTNGTFTGSATGWTLGDCLSYGSNQVTATYNSCSSMALSQAITLSSGTTYLVSFDLTSTQASSSVAVYFNNQSSYTQYHHNGHVAYFFTADSDGADVVYIDSSLYGTNETYSIDNVSIRPALALKPSFALYDIFGARSAIFADGQSSNTAIGRQTLIANTTGVNNVALGNNALTTNTTGSYNTALGLDTLFSNTTGYSNNAIGFSTLLSNTTGFRNNAIGESALYANTTGSNNNALGYHTLYSNTSGTQNNAFGPQSLNANTTGSNNNALGYQALFDNTTGGDNNALGYLSLANNITGTRNNALGREALVNNTTGSYNTALGYQSLWLTTSGSYNDAIGRSALGANTTGSYNVALGIRAGDANTVGTSTTILGAFADVGSNNLSTSTAIGAGAIVGCSNCLVLGGTGLSAVNVGIGTTSPYAKLSVAGHVVGQYFTATSTATSTFPTLSVTGAFYDSAGTAGANGYVLQTTGSGVEWVATSSLNIAGSGSGTVGSGTTGQVPYYASGGTTLTATSSLFIAANGDIGVGTSSPAYTLDVYGDAAVTGSLTLLGTGQTTTLTPLGSSVNTKIDIPAFDPGAFGQVVAMGIPSGANTSARVLSLFDQRASDHQPTLAIFSPNEEQVAGLSWEGLNTAFALKSSQALVFETAADTLPTVAMTGGTGFSSLTFPTPGTTQANLHLYPINDNDDTVYGITFGAASNNGSPDLYRETAQAGLYVQSSDDYGTRMYLGTTDSYATGAQVGLMIDESRYVGIGTTTDLNARLNIQSAGTDDILNLFETSGQEVFTVLEDGSVGIGTTSPAKTLGVTGDIYVDGTATSTFTSNVHVLGTFKVGASSVYITENGIQATNDFSVETNNLGVGTTSPLTNLDVYGNLALSGGSRYLNFGATSSDSIGTSGFGIRDNAGTLEYRDAGGTWTAFSGASHDAVTLAGQDFLSLSGQQITANAINPDNLAATDFGDFTCNGTTCSLDATYLTGNQTITLSGDVSGSGATSITVALASNSIIEPDLNADVAPIDGDFLQYDSTGTNFTWRDASEMRSDLGLVIGTNVQAYDADLTTYAGITPSANVQSLLGAASYAAMRTLLDLEAGTDFYSISAADAAFEVQLNNEAGLYAVLSDVTQFWEAGDTINSGTLALDSLSYTGAIGSTEIDDVYVFNSGDVITGGITINSGGVALDVTNSGRIDIGAADANPPANNTEGTVLLDGNVRVNAAAGVAAFFGRTNDGVIIQWYSGGSVEGSVSVSGTTVSYNAFTGSHYVTTEEVIKRGELVSITGDAVFRHGTNDSEPTYYAVKSATKNAPNILGSMLTLTEPDLPHEPIENPYLVMAVGNGDMWVADNGEDIAAGDYLISSDVPGHAEKDVGEFTVAHIVAKAAEDIDWSGVTTTVDGTKHAKIAVTFEQFDKWHGIFIDPVTGQASTTASSTAVSWTEFVTDDTSLWSRLMELARNFVDGVLEIAGLRTNEICLTDGGGETCIDRAGLNALLQQSVTTQSSNTVGPSGGSTQTVHTGSANNNTSSNNQNSGGGNSSSPATNTEPVATTTSTSETSEPTTQPNTTSSTTDTATETQEAAPEPTEPVTEEPSVIEEPVPAKETAPVEELLVEEVVEAVPVAEVVPAEAPVPEETTTPDTTS